MAGRYHHGRPARGLGVSGAARRPGTMSGIRHHASVLVAVFGALRGSRAAAPGRYFAGGGPYIWVIIARYSAIDGMPMAARRAST